MAERRSPDEQLKSLFGNIFESLAAGEPTKEVKERFVDQVATWAGKEVAACAKCGGPVDELEAADGETKVQVCAARCGKKAR
jgi:hypothetical protein